MDDYGQRYIDSRKEIDPREILLFKVESKVKNAKMWLFIVGGFTIALALFYFFFRYHQLNVLSTVIDCTIGLVYIGLAFFVNKKPYTAVLVGLILYITTIVPVSYTHLRPHETVLDNVCRLLLDKLPHYTLLCYNPKPQL
mgnify:CR=1 FL=1